MNKDMLNGSGYVDKTAYHAINKVTRDEKNRANRDVAAEVLIRALKDIIWLAGFRLIDRIKLEDPKTGKKYT